ncbi:unnamed protein product [Gordionus sp. m RMFG-2023]
MYKVLNPNTENCQLGNQPYYSNRKFRIKIGKNRGKTYNIIIKFSTPDSLMPDNSTMDYSFTYYNVNDKMAPRQILANFNNNPVGINPIIKNCRLRNKSLYGPKNFRIDVTKDEGETYDIEITFRNTNSTMPSNTTLHYFYATLHNVSDKMAPHQIFQELNSNPMGQNKSVIKDLNKNLTYFLKITIGFKPYAYIPVITWQTFKFDFRLAPMICNASAIDSGRGKLNLSVSWESNHIEEDFTGFFIELSPTSTEMNSHRQEHIITNNCQLRNNSFYGGRNFRINVTKDEGETYDIEITFRKIDSLIPNNLSLDYSYTTLHNVSDKMSPLQIYEELNYNPMSRDTSFNFSDVTPKLEYRITLRVLFRDYDNDKLFFTPYSYHTIFITDH